MSTGPVFRASLEARQRLLSGREEIKQQHQVSSPGIQICTRLAELLDGVILDLYEAGLTDLCPQGSEELRSQRAGGTVDMAAATWVRLTATSI